jgi:DNA polymerase III alpha subunit (gram-positive type)
MFKERGISHLLTYNELQASYVERVIKTLKVRLYRWMLHNQTYAWSQALKDVTESYNGSIHRALGRSPEKVNSSNEGEVRMQQYLIKTKRRVAKQSLKKEVKVKKEKEPRKKPKKKPQYKIGDIVRISTLRSKLNREYDTKFTGELFKVRKAYMREDTPVYQLSDWEDEPISGTFYKEELVEASEPDEYKIEKILKKRGKGKKEEYLVRWLHWPKKFDQWIPASTARDLQKP